MRDRSPRKSRGSGERPVAGALPRTPEFLEAWLWCPMVLQIRERITYAYSDRRNGEKLCGDTTSQGISEPMVRQRCTSERLGNSPQTLVFVSHNSSFLTNVFRIDSSFLIAATKATFFGFPALTNR